MHDDPAIVVAVKLFVPGHDVRKKRGLMAELDRDHGVGEAIWPALQ